jgi:outer membrane receptor for ferrienterochelin and colicins
MYSKQCFLPESFLLLLSRTHQQFLIKDISPEYQGKAMTIKFSLTIILFILAAFANAQTNLLVEVIDDTTEKPVPYAHVQLKPLPKGKNMFSITDDAGRAVFTLKGKNIITVSFLGYKTFSDTITGKNKKITVKLQPSSITMEDVVVTGHAAPVKADKSIYNVKVLDMKKEEGKAAVDLYQMLSTESNIRLQQDKFLGGRMTMQGLSGEYIKVLIDGVPMTGRMDGNIDITQINMNDVDHIEIVEGPLSVIYGSGALAGTINIITKEMKQDGTNTSASAYGESVGIANADFSLMHKKRRNSFGISGMGYFFNGWDNSDTLLRAKQWKPRNKFSASGYYRYKIKNLKLKASSMYFNENVLDKGEPFGDRNQNAFDHNYITDRWDVKTEGSHSINKKYKADVLLAYNYYERLNKKKFLNFDNNTSKEVSTDTSRFDQISSRMIWSTNNYRRIEWSAGYDILWEKYSGNKVLNGSQDIGDYAGFATLNYSPVDILKIQAGARGMYNSKYKAPVIYSLNILYSPFKIWQNRFSFSKGFKSPDLKQLYLDFNIMNISITGNPDLNAENSYNVNLYSTIKFTKFRQRYSISAKAFYNKIDDKIELVSVNNNDMKYSYINIYKIKTAGYGLDFSFRNTPHYSFSLSWTTTGLWNGFGELYDSPDNFTWYTDVSSTFNYSFARQGINLSVNYKFNGKAPQYILNNGIVGLYERDSYNMLDFSAAKRLFKNRLTLMAGVRNILNVTDVKQTLDGNDYVSMRGSDLIAYGRSFFMKLNYSF